MEGRADFFLQLPLFQTDKQMEVRSAFPLVLTAARKPREAVGKMIWLQSLMDRETSRVL